MNLKAINYLIFDLDGTLIDSSAGVVEATNYGLESIGENKRTPDEIKKFIGYPLDEMFHTFSKGSYDKFWENFQKKGLEVIAAYSRPLDGADDVLRELHQRGYIMGIATTKIRVHINRILDRFRWRNLFDGFIGADDVTSVKPHPEALLKLQRKIGGNHNNTLVIGDTENDVYAAHAADIPVIGLISSFGDNERLQQSQPDIILDNLGQLSDLLPGVS